MFAGSNASDQGTGAQDHGQGGLIGVHLFALTVEIARHYRQPVVLAGCGACWNRCEVPQNVQHVRSKDPRRWQEPTNTALVRGAVLKHDAGSTTYDVQRMVKRVALPQRLVVLFGRGPLPEPTYDHRTPADTRREPSTRQHNTLRARRPERTPRGRMKEMWGMREMVEF